MKLLNFIKLLKPHYQDVINLRYFQEMSYLEISNQLEEPLNNVKVRLLRARKLLAEIIKSLCVVIIIIMMGLLAVLPSVIFKDGIIDTFEKRMNRLINLTMFSFFLLINSLLIYIGITYS